MNKWRSPTAEKIYRNNPLLNVRSAGTSSKARRRVSGGDLKWADVVFVMETKHKQRLVANHPELMKYLETHVLDIEDNYRYMDQALIDELRASIDPVLEGYA